MKRIVIKIGSSSLVDDNGVLDLGKVDRLVKEISLLKQDGIMPILVSSGAIAVGRSMLNIKPQNIAEKQALAAVGQASLMHEYEVIFNRYDLKCAQILLNHDDFDVRKRVLNLETTINTLIEAYKNFLIRVEEEKPISTKVTKKEISIESSSFKYGNSLITVL